MPAAFDVDALVEGIKAGNRSAMARSITLMESKKPAHRPLARQLLTEIAPLTGNSIRLGLTGVPGAGKSTFTDALGCRLIEKYHKRVAVLAVDPSSSVTGGSVLGDRTRMGQLTSLDESFVRPSPSGSHLGGVARATREAMLIVEAAGYDVVIVETVGVGQSETAVSGMVDTFLLLSLTGSGDQLQGIKKGILEMADVIAVNKADGPNEREARVAARELAIAMKLVSKDPSGRVPPVLTCSALQKNGLDEVWQAVLEHREWLDKTVGLDVHRGHQQVSWMWAQAESAVLDSLHRAPEIRPLARELEEAVAAGRMSALGASKKILRQFAKVVDSAGWSD